jgi:hypothetical protein
MAKMSPEARQYYKPRVTVGKIILLELINIILWLAVLLLSLPVVTEVISEFIGLVIINLLNWSSQKLMKMYEGSDNHFTKFMVTTIMFLIDSVPFVNDLPAGPIEVLIMYYITRKEDRKIAEEKAKEAAEARNAAQIRAYQYNQYMQQRAQAQNAQIQAANDNAQQRRAANDNARRQAEPEEFAEAA